MLKKIAWLSLFFCSIAFAKNIPEFKGGLLPEAKIIIPENAWNDCSKTAKNPDEHEECMLTYLKDKGASPQAIAFYQYSNGYILLTKEYGPVTVVNAQVRAADHSDAYYLLNTDGDFVDVDDFDLLNKADLKSNPMYKAIVNKHPKAMMFGGNHLFPKVKTAMNGVREFVFEYPINDGCRACTRLGIAKIAFVMGPRGKFTGVKLIGVDKK